MPGEGGSIIGAMYGTAIIQNTTVTNSYFNSACNCGLVGTVYHAPSLSILNTTV